MSEETTDAAVTYQDVIRTLELQAITTFEVRGRRRDGGFDDLEPPEESSTEEDEAIEVATGLPEIRIYVNETDQLLSVRAVLDEVSTHIEYRVDIAAGYRKAEPIDISNGELQAQVIELLALPNLFPYLRQTLSDLSSRLGYPLLLPLARLGGGQVRPLGRTARID